jgi:RNA polymerase sigma-70 factor (ECF subfamily)
MGDTQNKLDTQAINNYIAGDSNSFNDLIGRYERPIYNLAYRFSGNAGDAADITQEIFIHLHRKIKSFRGESAFSTWFYRLAVNYCKDWLHKESRRVRTVDTVDIAEIAERDGGDEPVLAYERQEIREIVQTAITQLPEDQRIAVILHDIQGYDYDTIAGIVSVPIGTVKSRLARARHKLSEKLAPYGNGWQE